MLPHRLFGRFRLEVDYSNPMWDFAIDRKKNRNKFFFPVQIRYNEIEFSTLKIYSHTELRKPTRRSCAGMSFTCCNVKFVITDCWGCCWDCGCCCCCCCWVCCCWDCCYFDIKHVKFSNYLWNQINSRDKSSWLLSEISGNESISLSLSLFLYLTASKND